MKILYRLCNIVMPCLAVAFLFFAGACSNGRMAGSQLPPGDTLTVNSDYLTLVSHTDGTISATITNPWDTTQALARYLLVPESNKDVTTVDGYRTIRVPVRSALVYSSVHASPLEELGAGSIIRGVADAQYFRSPYILNGVNSGRIVDIGSSMSPSFEKVIQLSPQIALTSPYENAGHGILENAGITVVDMADYMEPTPKGRAEWILLLGALSGRLDKAKDIYAGVVEEYDSIRAGAVRSGSRPTIITEIPYSGVWYQPGGRSYMARLIEDAGGSTLLPDDTSTGSVQMDIANVYQTGRNADKWIIKTDRPLTLNDIKSTTVFADKIKAFSTADIWLANTSSTTDSAVRYNLYDDLAFHPERVLADFAIIFSTSPHSTPHPTRYYLRLTR